MEIGLGNSISTPRGGGPSEVPVNSDHVKMLLHLHTDFLDSSVNNNSPTLVGTPTTIDTSRKVFGAGSAKFNGGNGRWSLPASTDWYFGDGVPAQLSWRLYLTSSGEQWFFHTGTYPGAVKWQLGSFNSKFRFWSSGQVDHNFGYTIPLNQWLAFRFNYDGGNTYRLYVNGTLKGSKSNGINNGTQLTIGATTNGIVPINGNMQEVLWQKHADLVITTDSTYDVETDLFVIA